MLSQTQSISFELGVMKSLSCLKKFTSLISLALIDILSSVSGVWISPGFVFIYPDVSCERLPEHLFFNANVMMLYGPFIYYLPSAGWTLTGTHQSHHTHHQYFAGFMILPVSKGLNAKVSKQSTAKPFYSLASIQSHLSLGIFRCKAL